MIEATNLPRRTAVRNHRFRRCAPVVLFVAALIASGPTPQADAQGTSTTSPTSSSSSSTVAPTTTTSTTVASTSTTAGTTTSTTAPTTSTTSTSTTIGAIGEVRELTAQVSAVNQVTLRWVAPAITAGLSGYRITTEPSGAVVTVAATQTMVVLTLAPGKYTFAVVAVGSSTTSQPVRINVFLSGETTTTTGPTTTAGPLVLSAPQRVTATPSGVGQVNVFWEPPTWSQANQGARRVKEYRITSVPGSSTVVVPATALSATFAGLGSGITYYFSVRAVTDDGVASEAGLSAGLVLAPSAATATTTAAAPPATIIVPPQPTQPPAVPSPPGVPKPCVSAAWNGRFRGTPVTFRKGAPQGAFVWFDGRYWQLRVFHPGPDAVIFTGSVEANARITTYGTQLDPRTDILRRGRTSASFSFRAANDVDGLRISAPCATLLSMRIEINGQALPIQQIYVGTAAANPSGQPVQFVR